MSRPCGNGGSPAVYGNAVAPGVLEAANIGYARVIVVVTPEGFQTQRIIERAREANPRIDTAVRAHTEGEVARLDRQGVGIAIMGARELALGLMDFALRSLGVPEDKARTVVQQIRTSGEGGAFERHLEPGRGAPELRPRQEQEPTS